MRFLDSINTDIPKPKKDANSDSSSFLSDTSTEPSNTTHSYNPDFSSNDTSS